MNKVNLINQLKFSNELVKLFDGFTKYLDFYFKEEENINNNKELYDNYKKFSKNITDVAIKYGVFKR